MRSDSQHSLPHDTTDKLVIIPRAQFRRLRAGWTLLGAAMALGIVGGILRNTSLISACLIVYFVIMLLNRAILKSQEELQPKARK